MDSAPPQGLDKEILVTTDPLRHAEIAQQLPPPTPLTPRPLTPDQIGNLEMMASDPQAYMAKVSTALQYWAQRKEELRSVNVESVAKLPADKQATVGKIDLFLLNEMITRSNHTDTNYVPDMVAGFPVTGSIPDGGCGTPLQGGQRVHGQPGLGGPEPIDELRNRCLERNTATLKASQARLSGQHQDTQLLEATWAKFQQDVDKGYVGEPQELSSVNLSEILLVDSFGIWERHAGSEWKTRVINNYRSNHVNSYSWVPSRIKYDDFTELMEAAKVLKNQVCGNLLLGKSDFKSAFKTLPIDSNQAWLSWCLVYNPVLQRHQVAPLKSQSFGSVGAVMAWYRTAMVIQTILQSLFFVTVFVYVDDCFWVTPQFSGDGPHAGWIALTFQYVVEELLGWKLDPSKSAVGEIITLLGLRVKMGAEASEWQLSPDKAAEWISDIKRALATNCLLPSEASKLCGRLGFLNSKLYGKLARALIRPLIWRQIQQVGSTTVTPRLRNSLLWFLKALDSRWTRQVPYTQLMPCSQAILYSDAESEGHVGVVLLYNGRAWYGHKDLPNSIRRLLKQRRTNIMGYELIAAIMVILLLDTILPQPVCVRHYVDNTSAKACIVTGHSKQADLNKLVGMLWYTAAHRCIGYYCEWVQSAANLADGPSRRNFQLMKQLEAKEVCLDTSRFRAAADNWELHPKAASLLARSV